MKLSDLTGKEKELAEFACLVCMGQRKQYTLNYKGCAVRNIGKEYCPVIEKIVQERQMK